jgi:hypothetical protein
MDPIAHIDDVSYLAELPKEPTSASSDQTVAERHLIEIGQGHSTWRYDRGLRKFWLGTGGQLYLWVRDSES